MHHQQIAADDTEKHQMFIYINVNYLDTLSDYKKFKVGQNEVVTNRPFS